MNIEHKNFMLKPGTGKSTFDLLKIVPDKVTAKHHAKGKYKDKKIGDPTGETREELIGYDYSISSAIKQIILLRLRDKKGTVSLSEWLAAYVKEKEELASTIKKVL